MKAPAFLVLAVGMSLLGPFPASAEGIRAKGDASTHWLISPYFLAPYMNGTATVRGLEAAVDVDPSDVFENLKFGAMLYTEAQGPMWAVGLDAMYMNLGAEGTTPLGTVEVGMKQTGIMLQGYRRVAPWAEAMVGVQFNKIEGSLVGSGPLGVNNTDDETWVDPEVGARLTVPFTGKWRASVLGMIGGFGVGSDVAWQVYPQLGYQFSHTFGMAVAYRAMAMDYTTGTGNEEFRYDLVTQGSQAALKFSF